MVTIKADAGVQFAGMPFDLGNHTTFLVPRTGLIAEVGVVAANMVGRPTNGPGQQVGDAFLENRVDRKADRIQKALGFEVFVNVRRGKRRVTAKIEPNLRGLVAFYHRLQNVAPSIGTVNVAGT